MRLLRGGNMPELMARADVAVSAGGSTCWEVAFMGLPFLIVVLAENQEHIAKELEKCDKELEKVEEELAKGRYDHAIDHYKHAWKHAQKALKKFS